MLDKIIDSYEDEHLKGIPIGNLTSQLFANIYMNELDQYAVNLLNKLYFNTFPRYFRYMDDFVILADTKNELRTIRNQIENFLNKELDLILHPRKQLIQNISFGIDFCGYNVFKDKIILRKSTARRFVRKYKRVVKRIKKQQQRDQIFIFDQLEEESAESINELEEKLWKSTLSHMGFLKHSQIELTDKDYIYVNKVRLPFLPKSVKLTEHYG